MKNEQIVSRLRQVESLLAECLQVLGEKSKGTTQPRPAKKSSKNGLPDKIIALRDKGFFSQPKTARDVQAKLNPTYVCEVDRASTALLRLVERKKLRKASKQIDGKKQVAYVW